MLKLNRPTRPAPPVEKYLKTCTTVICAFPFHAKLIKRLNFSYSLVKHQTAVKSNSLDGTATMAWSKWPIKLQDGGPKLWVTIIWVRMFIVQLRYDNLLILISYEYWSRLWSHQRLERRVTRIILRLLDFDRRVWQAPDRF